jgi:hypothetical protein
MMREVDFLMMIRSIRRGWELRGSSEEKINSVPGTLFLLPDGELQDSGG